MTLYIPAAVWILGAGLGYFILKKQSVKLTVVKNILIALPGPFSIAIAFLYKSDNSPSKQYV